MRKPSIWLRKLRCSVLAAGMVVAGCASISGSLAPPAVTAASLQVACASRARQSPYVYVASEQLIGSELTVYRCTSLIRTVRTSLGSFSAIDLDSSGDLYIADRLYDQILIYSPGAVRHLHTVTDGVSGPDALLLDRTGNLYVANYFNNSVTMYAAGTMKLLGTVKVLSPAALALDSTGRLYVASYYGNSVQVYSRRRLIRIIRDGVSGPVSIVSGGHDRLYVANAYMANSVTMYSREGERILTIRKGVGTPTALALNSNGDLYVASQLSGNRPGLVSTYSRGSESPLRRITNEISDPSSLALDAADDLFVANHSGGNNSVAVFAATSGRWLYAITNAVDGPVAVRVGTN